MNDQAHDICNYYLNYFTWEIYSKFPGDTLTSRIDNK